ncbi:MAG: 16S rRNA (cytosine(1402)-N(4))-methyltransferase RsmH [Myxococcales bacterium]|nr:16S rRNA (cytosine(1402)-N(4))-methyltransferase RsmH [Myxococcales bacterium]MDH3485034.1 16S rRNA (cytosine(1402)-N(4))-methyltransferase RsmH [Myxococcales bacterium]
MMAFDHTPVLLQEVLEYLRPVSGGVYADVTLGGGGHARAILERSAPDGRVVGTDRDPQAVDAARVVLREYGDRVTLRKARMRDLSEVLRSVGIAQVDGIVADLGVSSAQLDQGDRGFSLAKDGPIDMRMDPTEGETALELIARTDAEELANVIYRYGEEGRSRRIARSLRHAYEEGELETTADLRRAVHRAIGPRRSRIDPATRTFQALRIAVNDELSELESLLEQLPSVLREGGVAAVISFHSLEDRMVKHSFRDSAQLTPLTKRPVMASDEERQDNPRSRSAKLRAARRLEVAA